jgi:hypothetical protein
MRKMPPGMRMGGKLASWLQRYRQQLTPAHQQRIQDYIASYQAGNQQAAMAEYQEDFEYGYVSRTSEERFSLNPPLFVNQPPPVIVMPRGTYERPDWREYAAAFPLSFNQTGVTPPAPGPPKPQPSSPAQVPSPEVLQELMEQMRSCLQRAEAALNGCSQPSNTTEAPLPAVAATAAAAGSSKEGRRVRWADELQGRQQQQLASGLQPLAEELQRLMRQHGVKPGSSDPTGLYGIRLQLTKERRYTLDRFENQNPQTGFSLVLPGGQLVMPAKAISDSGCTFSLVDKDWADSVGWRYRPTKIRLVLADNTCSRVTGITEPAWGMVAAGTPQEGRALMQALVVEGAGDTFQLAVGKEHLALHSACVLQDEQAFSYRSVTGERCTLPVTCYEEEPAAAYMAIAREGRSRGYQIKETARVAALAPSLRQLSFGLVADSSQEVTAAMMECFEQPQTLQPETAEQQLGRGGAEGFTKTEAADKDALGGTTAAVAEHNDLEPAVPGLSLGGGVTAGRGGTTFQQEGATH